MKRTIVVLGATGKVGGKIAALLLREGHQLRLISRSEDLKRRFGGTGAELIVGDITDADLLTAGFKGADSAFVLLPPNLTVPDYRSFQREVGDAAIEAIKRSGIKHIVNLSSAGAHLHEGNGLIAGLAEQEVKLNQLKDVHIMHLRPAYFLDNVLLNIHLIKNAGFNATTAATEYPIPMVATSDVAAVAAAALASPDFKGNMVRPVLGDRNYSFREITGIIGKSIGMPDLQLVQLPGEQAKAGMISQGISENVAEDIVNMEVSLQNGIMNYQQRTVENSSPTSAKVFAETVFAPAYFIA